MLVAALWLARTHLIFQSPAGKWKMMETYRIIEKKFKSKTVFVGIKFHHFRFLAYFGMRISDKFIVQNILVPHNHPRGLLKSNCIQCNFTSDRLLVADH